MKPQSSVEIEQAIINRMREAYSDGHSSEELSEFFEEQGDKVEIPLLRDSEKRKIRVVSVTPDDRGARRDGVRRYGNYVENDGDPTTNRGVTIHEKIDKLAPVTKHCPHILGGYDGGVEVGFSGKWRLSLFRDLLSKLEKAKKAAQDSGNPDRIIDYNNCLYEVKPKSATGEVNYKYVVEGDGVKFYIHSNPVGEIQPIRIRYSAEGLIGRDLFHKHNEILELLNSIGFTVTGEKLSRVDMQVMVYRSVIEFMRAIQSNKYVCSARSYSTNGKGQVVDTIILGQALQICIYDKRKELFDHVQSEPYKFALMVRCCFGVEWLEQEIPVTRIEFRVRRSILKILKINTIDDLLYHESGLSRYCCHTWFRLLSEPKKIGHTHEQKTSRLWKEVQLQFAKYFPGVEGHNIEVKGFNRTKIISCSAEALEKQAIGCLKTAAALRLGTENVLSETEKYIVRVISDEAEAIAKGALDRAIRYGISSGAVTPDEYLKIYEQRKEELRRYYD
jgi:hypothetical protein